MEPSTSLRRVKEIRAQTLERPPKDELQVVRWKGRTIVIRKGASFPWWGKDPSNEDSDLNQKSPIELLLKMLRQSKKKDNY